MSSVREKSFFILLPVFLFIIGIFYSATFSGASELSDTESPLDDSMSLDNSCTELSALSANNIDVSEEGNSANTGGTRRKLLKSSSKCKTVLSKNLSGGCNVRLSEPNKCQTIKLPYVFGWTTDGTYCETPWTFILAGNPVNIKTGDNTWQWSLSENIGKVSHYGGTKRITAKDLKHVTTNNGTYHWVVMSYYGSHPASRAFRVKK